MRVHDFLAGTAQRVPEKTALICAGRRWTYAQLEELSARFATLLQQCGVAPGDRVVVHLPNDLAAVVGIFGVLKAGAVFVPVNPTTKADKLDFILRNCRASALLTEMRGPVSPATPWLKTIVRCDAEGAPGAVSGKPSPLTLLPSDGRGEQPPDARASAGRSPAAGAPGILQPPSDASPSPVGRERAAVGSLPTQDYAVSAQTTRSAGVPPALRVGETRAGATPALRLVGSASGAPTDLVNFDSLSQFPPLHAPPATRPDDLACLIYTSGSTGEPKGVMCEHQQVVFASGSIIQYLGNTGSDIVLSALPLSFDYGLYQLLMTFRFGGTLVLERSFAFPVAVLQKIAAERVTGFPGVPTMFALLLRLELGAFDLSSLRYLTNTAAALPPSHVLELHRRFPSAKLFSMYGLTETKRTLYLPPEQIERRPGSVGIPIPGTEAWLEDELGRRCTPGETGELVIRGPHVMRGYWEAPEATAQRFRPDPATGGRLCYSGDLFRQDDEGFFYFVGRRDDIIKSRGEKVAPKEVETVLCALPGVAEAAVLGAPDPVLGQAIKAFIVRRDAALTATQVLAHCRARLEDFMVPQSVEFRDELPRNNSGKVDKRALAERRSPDRREPGRTQRADAVVGAP